MTCPMVLAEAGGQYVYLGSQRHCHTGAYSWVYHRVDTQGDYTKTETSKVYQLQNHGGTHSLTHTHPEKKNNPILQIIGAFSTAENTHTHTHTQIWQLELFPTIFLPPSLCLNSPHLYLRELAPCVLSFTLCKVNKMPFTSKTKFPNFLIDNPALDIELCQAGFCSYDNRAAFILWCSLLLLFYIAQPSRIVYFSGGPSESFHNYGG